MSALHIHLFSVHVPVVGVIVALGLLLAGRRRPDVTLAGYGVILFSAAVAGIAYYSGPASADQLASPAGTDPWVDQHALAGRAFFFALALTAILTLQALVFSGQGDAPPAWLRRLIMLLLGVSVYLAVWSAHLGGAIRHQEIREPEWLLLPHPQTQSPPPGATGSGAGDA